MEHKKIKSGKYIRLNAPIFQHTMTGTREVGIFPGNLVKVQYVCGAIEEAVIDDDTIDSMDIFKIVSAVQAKR